MLALLLIGCDGAPPVGETLELAKRGLGDAKAVVVQARVGGGPAQRHTGTTRWNGADLAEALAPCGIADGGVVEASLVLRPGTWPHEVRAIDGVADAAQACVEGQLSRFPFAEPAGRDEVDVVVVRVPLGGVSGRTVATSPAGSTLSKAPPAAWVTDDPEAIDLDTLRIVDGTPRWRRGEGRLTSGDMRQPGEVARVLACDEGAPGLVRTVLVFAHGELEEVETSPRSACVELKARINEDVLARHEMAGGRPIADWARAVAVLDVPVGPW